MILNVVKPIQVTAENIAHLASCRLAAHPDLEVRSISIGHGGADIILSYPHSTRTKHVMVEFGSELYLEPGEPTGDMIMALAAVLDEYGMHVLGFEDNEEPTPIDTGI